MPSKKSDQGRKSEVSVARFVVMDEGSPTPTPATEPAAAVTTNAEGSGDATGTETPVVVPRIGQEEKKTNKDPEKKEKADKDAITIEDLSLPKSIITRLAKGVLPSNTQIQASAVLAMSKSTTVFINYLASHANEHVLNANKKTIMPEDVFKALEDTEFSFLKDSLEAELAKYTDMRSTKRKVYRASRRGDDGETGGVDAGGAGDDSHMADISSFSATGAADDTMMTTAEAAASRASPSAAVSASDQPRAKKAKISGAGAVAAVAGSSAALALRRGGDEAETEVGDAAEEEEDEEEEEEDDDDDDEEEDNVVDEEDDEEEDDEHGGESEDSQDPIGEDDNEHTKDDVDEALDGDESD